MIGASILVLAGLAILGGFFVCWPLAIIQAVLNGRLLPWTPRRHVPWKLLDVVVIVLPIVLLVFGPLLLLKPPNPAAKPLPPNLAQSKMIIAGDILIKAVLIVLATAYVVFKAKARLQDLAGPIERLGLNLLIGLIAFVMLMPPVIAVQALIVYFGDWKYEHPLIEMLQKTPDPLLFMLLAISACIMAPLSEEWLFRGLLQGWLEKACAWIARRGESLPPVAPADLVASDTAAPLPVGAADALNPYAASAYAPVIDRPPPVTADDEAIEEPFPRAVFVHLLPIVVSAVLFGLAHWGHGPAPIPLTLLALGLGYVYQRTHSIVPVMVVHCLFNSFSMLIFYVMLFELKQPLP